jgi:hypothetical protein
MDQEVAPAPLVLTWTWSPSAQLWCIYAAGKPPQWGQGQWALDAALAALARLSAVDVDDKGGAALPKLD